MKKLSERKSHIYKMIDLMYNDGCTIASIQVTQLGRPALSDDVKELFASIKKLVPAYNEFNAEKTCKILTKLRRKIYTIRFGREYSPVIYIKPLLLGKTKAENERNAKALMLEIVAELHPDEYSIEECKCLNANGHQEDMNSSYELRFWFD